MPSIKVEPTIPNYPPQGIQAQLDLLYLWNPDVANDLIEQLNKALEEVASDLSAYLTKAEAADTYATQTEVTQLSGAVEEVSNKVDTLDNDLKELGGQTASIQQDVNTLKTGKQDRLNASQLSAINSGITSAKVTAYDAYAADISQAQNDATKAENAAEVAQQTANLAGQEAAQALTGLAGKVNINQGADNAGKVMSVGADGNLAPADAPSSSLPDQTGNAGKFLTTDGTSASWGEVQAAAITTDATLTGNGTTDSPLGIAQSVQDSIDGKVSKSGDTMTGTLNLATDTGINAFTIGNYRMFLNGTQLDLYYKNTPVFSYNPASGLQAGSLQKYFGTASAALGSNENQWVNVYTEKLNNGADIAIPTTGGTMALLSDIPDISNLATKTEVQQEIQDAIGTIETALAEV